MWEQREIIHLITYLIIIDFAMFDDPLFPQFVHCRRWICDDQEGQKHHGTQGVHPEKEGKERGADVTLV